MVEACDLWTVVISLIVVKLCHWIYQWSNPKCSGMLPPGSMGFPIIGETFQYMKPHDAFQLPTFVSQKVLRYGPIFRTSLFGAKVIISTDSALNMEIAKTCNVPGIPQSLVRLFGKNNLFVQSKESHKLVRNLTHQFLALQYLKFGTMQDVDLLSSKYMKFGAKNGVLDVKEITKKILIESLATKVIGDMEPEAVKDLIRCWIYFPSNWFKFSWNIPGSGVYRMLKARKQMLKLLKELVLKKRASGEEMGEFFKMIFGEKEEGKETISVENAIEYIYIVFLVANETGPNALSAIVKLISNYPKVKEELRREHERIVQGRTDKEAGLTWEDYKSMTFTHMVINEALRVISTGPTVHRIADREVIVGDYTIPVGWTIMGYPCVHFNPEKYDDPLAFNPWRWEGKDLSAIITKNFIPFGAGPRLCLGADFVKLQMAIFIHHLSKYSWSMKKEITVIRRPMLKFPAGSDIQISEHTKVDNSSG